MVGVTITQNDVINSKDDVINRLAERKVLILQACTFGPIFKKHLR